MMVGDNMKILLISDIHGNLEALEAVLALERWDLIYCMGDLVDYGPSSPECVELITERAVAVRGNHDNAVAFGVDCGCGYEMKELSRKVRNITIGQMADRHLKYLGNLPLELSIGGYYMTHGTPKDFFAYIKPETQEEYFDVFSSVDESLVLLGHSHIPMDRMVGDKRYINPGSLGQPRDGDPRSSYAFFEDGDLHFGRIEYDMDTTIEKMKRIGIPDRAIRVLEEGRIVR